MSYFSGRLPDHRDETDETETATVSPVARWTGQSHRDGAASSHEDTLRATPSEDLSRPSSSTNTNVNNFADSVDNSSECTDTADSIDDADSADDSNRVDVAMKVRLQTVTFAHWFISQILQATGGDTSGDYQHRLIDDVARFVRHLADVADAVDGSIMPFLRSIYSEDSSTEGVVKTESIVVHNRGLSPYGGYGNITM